MHTFYWLKRENSLTPAPLYCHQALPDSCLLETTKEQL